MSIEDPWIENLEEWVLDEQKVVSIKWLARELKVSTNQAKRMITQFGEKHKEKLYLIYALLGVIDKGFVIRLVGSDDLPDAKKEFNLITSMHIYGVCSCKTAILESALWEANMSQTKQMLNDNSNHILSNAFSGITASLQCSKQLTPLNDAPEIISEQVKAEKVEIKASTAKPKNKSNDKIQSMFDNAKQKQKAQEKNADNEQDKKRSKKQEKSADKKGSKKQEKSADKEQDKEHGKEKNAEPKSGKAKKKSEREKHVSTNSPFPQKVIPNKVNEDIFHKSSEESDDEFIINNIGENMVDLPEVKETEFDQDFVDESPKRKEPQSILLAFQQPQPRKKRKIMVTKTIVDDKGYLVTEDVWEEDPNDDQQVKSPLINPKQKPSPKVQEHAEKKSKKKPAKNTNNKGDQKTVTDFFSKKQ